MSLFLTSHLVLLSVHPSSHPSSATYPRSGSWLQQPNQGGPDFFLLSYSIQLFKGDPGLSSWVSCQGPVLQLPPNTRCSRPRWPLLQLMTPRELVWCSYQKQTITLKPVIPIADWLSLKRNGAHRHRLELWPLCTYINTKCSGSFTASCLPCLLSTFHSSLVELNVHIFTLLHRDFSQRASVPQISAGGLWLLLVSNAWMAKQKSCVFGVLITSSNSRQDND